MNINIECEDDDYYNQFLNEISPRTNYGDETPTEETNKNKMINLDDLITLINKEKLRSFEFHRTGDYRIGLNKAIELALSL